MAAETSTLLVLTTLRAAGQYSAQVVAAVAVVVVVLEVLVGHGVHMPLVALPQEVEVAVPIQSVLLEPTIPLVLATVVEVAEAAHRLEQAAREEFLAAAVAVGLVQVMAARHLVVTAAQEVVLK